MSEQTEVEIEVQDAPEVSNEETSQEEVQEVVETPEDKLLRLEKENESFKKKTERQKAAYTAVQRKLQEQADKLKELEAKAPQQDELKPPNWDDYDDHEKFNDALADYKAELKLRERDKERLEQEKKDAQVKMQAELAELGRQRTAAYEGMKSSFIEEVPEYENSEKEFAEWSQTVQVPQEVQNAVVNQLYREDNVPAVIHYFFANGGENSDQLEEISKMSPTEAAVEIYKIQAKLKASPARKKEAEKPTPPKTVKGSGTGKKTLSQMNSKELMKWANS